MKIAYISCRALTNNWGELHSATSFNLIEYLEWCGFNSILLHKMNGGLIRELFSQIPPDLIVLSGGETIGVDVERDSFEFEVLEVASQYHFPVLGICRGMQIMGKYFGQGLSNLEDHAGTRHAIDIEDNFEVNSYHNFGFTQVFAPFEVLAKANDGSVEMFHHQLLPWLGVMWHPERENRKKWRNVLEWIK